MSRSILGLSFALVACIAITTHAAAQDAIPAGNYYAAYYDGHHGEIADGYWGRHGEFFWYKDRSGTWHRDDGSHFKREPARGFSLVHGSGIARQH
jgi:hypothetical protein